MASRDGSTGYSSDSKATEPEIEYDLEVDGWPHSCDQDDPNLSERNKVYADEPLADEEWLVMHMRAVNDGGVFDSSGFIDFNMV